MAKGGELLVPRHEVHAQDSVAIAGELVAPPVSHDEDCRAVAKSRDLLAPPDPDGEDSVANDEDSVANAGELVAPPLPDAVASASLMLLRPLAFLAVCCSLLNDVLLVMYEHMLNDVHMIWKLCYSSVMYHKVHEGAVSGK